MVLPHVVISITRALFSIGCDTAGSIRFGSRIHPGARYVTIDTVDDASGKEREQQDLPVSLLRKDFFETQGPLQISSSNANSACKREVTHI